MCNHIWRIVNDARVCLRCGITINRFNGKVIFDRRLPDKLRKGGEKK